MTSAGPASAAGPRDLVGLGRDAFADAIGELDARPFRARQLWHWVYERGVTDFAAMFNLPAALRAELPARFRVGRPAVARAQVSEDGTRKWLLRLDDGNLIETVFIPEEDRAALCISSQVGCTLTCAFCHTGTQKLVRNLTPGEIAGQVMLARDALGDWPSAREGRTITNIVLMGMGEPLYNYDHVAAALRLLMDDEGIAISKRRITLSTSGVVPMIARVGAELDVNLAISLHAPTDAVRDVLVPINRKYPIAELMAALRAYPGLSNARRITFEYVMLDGVNDSPADAKALVKLIAGIPAKFNLIPFNPWPGTAYATSPMERIERFAEILNAAGYAAPVRIPRGRDILAACGQLKSESLRPPRRAAASPAPLEPAAAP